MAEGRRRGRPPRNNGTPPGESPPAETERPVKVIIELSMSYADWPDFQQRFESDYADGLKEFASIDRAELIIPPRVEPEVVNLKI